MQNNELKKIYVDFITWYAPYDCFEHPEIVETEDLGEMLYNLEAIRNYNFPDPDEEDQKTLNKIDYIIGQFKAAGIISSFVKEG